MEFFLRSIILVIAILLMAFWLMEIVRAGINDYKKNKWRKSLGDDEVKKRFSPIDF